ARSLLAPPSQKDAGCRSLGTATTALERPRQPPSDRATCTGPAGRACRWGRRQYFAVGKLDGGQRRVSRAVFGGKAFHGDLVTTPHGVTSPAAESRQHSETP